MKHLKPAIVATLVMGAIIAGVHWGIMEARENARLDQQVNGLEDTANRLLTKLAANRVQQARLAPPTAKVDQRPAGSPAEPAKLFVLRVEEQSNQTTLAR